MFGERNATLDIIVRESFFFRSNVSTHPNNVKYQAMQKSGRRHSRQRTNNKGPEVRRSLENQQEGQCVQSEKSWGTVMEKCKGPFRPQKGVWILFCHEGFLK